MVDERKQREEICRIGRRLYEKNFVAAGAGNISVRIGRGRFLCTPTFVSKGFMDPDDIDVVDDDGRQVSGLRQRTSEVLLHMAIYRELADVNAVVHAHPPHATAYAVVGEELPAGVLPEVEVFLGRVPIASYETPGSEALAESVLPHIRDGASTILLANHGVVALGPTLQQTWFHIEMLEQYCHILSIVRQVGRVRPIPADKMAELTEIRRKMGLDGGGQPGDKGVTE